MLLSCYTPGGASPLNKPCMDGSWYKQIIRNVGCVVSVLLDDLLIYFIRRERSIGVDYVTQMNFYNLIFQMVELLWKNSPHTSTYSFFSKQ